MAAQLIDGLSTGPQTNASQPGPLFATWRTGGSHDLASAFRSLPLPQQQQIRSRLGAEGLQELLDLSRESDPEMFAEGLLGFGTRQEQADRIEIAGAVYSSLAGSEHLEPIRQRAQQRLDAVIGRGAFGGRAEFLLRRFAREAASPSMIVGMAGAQAVFGLTRAALLSRLATSPAASFLTRGIGAKALASSGAFLLEAPSFVAFTRGANAALGQTQDWNLSSLGREIAGSYLTLGAMRFTGWAGESAYGRMVGVPAAGARSALALQTLTTQASMLGGIYLGHALETRFGLRERVDGATTLIDSLAMLLQFHVGGRLMHQAFGPGFERFNQELHLRTELLDPIQPRPTATGEAWGQGLALATAGLSTEGLSGPETRSHDLFDPNSYMVQNGDGNGGNGDGNGNGTGSTPQPPPVSLRPPSPTAEKAGSDLGGIVRRIQSISKRFNLNVAVVPDGPLSRLPTQVPAPPIRSVREGILRAEGLGQSRRSLAFLRWGAHQLKNDPESQTRFLDLMQRVFEFQAKQREALDPVLKNLPKFNFRELNGLGARYGRSLEDLIPGSGRHFAEAMLLLERTRGWDSEEIFRNLTDEQLRELGLEPESRLALARNAHAFQKREMLRVLDHPLLRDLPETEEYRDSLQRFHRELEEIRRTLGEIKQEARELRKQIASTQDIESRQTYERRIKEITTRQNIGYQKAVSRLIKASSKYLEDPYRARVFLVENARNSSLTRGLQDADRLLLTSHIRDHLSELDPATREVAQSLLQSSEHLDILDQRSGLGRLLHGALRTFGLDSLPPLEVRGRYERALLDVIDHAPRDFWRFGPFGEVAFERAAEAQSEYYREVHATTQAMREAVKPLEQANDAFWEQYDREIVGLYTQDLRLQVRQVEGVLGNLQADLGRIGLDEIGVSHEKLDTVARSLGSFAFEKRYGEPYHKLRRAVEEAIANYENPATRGKNSRDSNRTLEVALKRIAEFRKFARDTLRAENNDQADFRAVSALMMPFVDKIDSSKRTRWRESLASGWPVLWRTFLRTAALLSSIERKESVSVLDRHFLNWASGITRASGSRFIVDPAVDHLVEAEPVVAAGNHNSWLDFLFGGTPAARAAQLQGRGSSRDAMRIGAKEGLGRMIGPVIEPAIDLLTEPVADSLPEYDGSVTNLARAMALGDVPSGRLGPRSAAVYDELTMSVASLVNPYSFDPFPAISSLLSPPQGGRSFNIADRATALTGRPQNLLITSTLNAYRLWPKPDRPLPLRDGPTTTATQFLPALTLTDLSTEARAGGTRANWLRTIWLNMGTMPEYQREVPSIAAMFRPFETPIDLAVESAIAQRFQGIEELYPTAEGIRGLETERRELEARLSANQGNLERAEESTAALRDLELVNSALDVQTRRLLRRRLHEIDLNIEAEREQGIDTVEGKGIRRMQRIVRARLKLLDRVEAKLAKRQQLDLTERLFVERMGTAIAGRDNLSGRDALLEQLDYYFRIPPQERDLKSRLTQAQDDYYEFVRNWNERRKDPANPEFQQLHVSEAEGYDSIWTEYRLAIETTLNLYGVTPQRWQGQIIPDMTFRREGNATIVEPRGWQPGREFSRGRLWRFLLDDTVGIVRVAKNLPRFDATPKLYLTLHGRGWGWRMLDRIQTRIRIENSENLQSVANTGIVVAPTHDSGAEFMNVPSVMHDYGINAFFMADRKFFDPFWGRREFSPLGLKFSLPWPKPPAFGAIKALLGPLEQYGHLAIDRSDRRAAMQVMGKAGKFIQETGRSVIVFPGGTRNPIRYDEQGQRYEGPIYGNRPGVALLMEETQTPVLPIGLVNGGVIFPKQNGDAFLRGGAALGREYIFRFGTPLFYEEIVSSIPRKLQEVSLMQHPLDEDAGTQIRLSNPVRGPELRSAVTKNLDRQFQELTGRPIGPPAPSKAKKGR